MVEAGFKDIQIWWLSLSTQQGTKVQSTLEGTETEKKQSQNYMGRLQDQTLQVENMNQYSLELSKFQVFLFCSHSAI